MPTYEELKARAQQVRDEVTIGGNTALRVGQLLMDMVDKTEESGESGGGSIVTVTEDENYINVNIIDNTPVLSVSAESIVMGGDTKTATFKVSGLRLRGDINIGVSGTGFTVDKESISPVDGTVAETTVTVTYGGSASASGSISVSSAGAVPASISLTYTEQQVPTIIVDDSAIAFKAGGGSTNQQTLTVQGVNLEAGITAAISGTDAGKFSVSPASIIQSGGTASGTLTITYSPAAADSGTHTATLTLSSSGATSKVITLNGAVSTLTVSKQSMTFSTDQGVAVTDTFTVEGTNLNSDITIAASGTGFSVSPNTIAQSGGTVASTTVTVTYSPSAAGTNTGSITIQSSGVTQTISLSGTAEAEVSPDAEGNFTKGGIHYKIIEGSQNVMVWNGESLSAVAATKYTGAINIPSTVVAGGVTYNVTKIGNYAFRDCTGVTSVTLPNGLVEIGYVAFYNCGFTALNIPDTVTTIDNSVANCTNLVDVTLPNNPAFTTIPAYFLSKCTKIRTLIVPASVTTYTDAYFCNNVPLTTLDIRSTSGTLKGDFDNMPTGSSVIIRKSDGVLSKSAYPFGKPSKSTLYVPSSLVSTYQSAAGWGIADGNGYGMFTGTNQIQAINE